MNSKSVFLRFLLLLSFIATCYIASCQQNKNAISVGENLDVISHFLEKANKTPCQFQEALFWKDRSLLIISPKHMNKQIINELKGITLESLIRFDKQPIITKKVKCKRSFEPVND